MLKLLLLLVAGYVLGSIPFSYLFTKWFSHKDVREHGSGNVGTTNVIRTAGKKAGALAFLGDFFKGVLACWIGSELLGIDGAALGGIAAVCGHCYSLFLHFTGGKGVATSAGVVGFLMPVAWVIGFPLFAVMVGVSGYVSLSSLSLYIMAIVMSFVLDEPVQVKATIVILGVFVFYRHWANICRLYHGEEPKIKKHLFK